MNIVIILLYHFRFIFFHTSTGLLVPRLQDCPWFQNIRFTIEVSVVEESWMSHRHHRLSFQSESFLVGTSKKNNAMGKIMLYCNNVWYIFDISGFWDEKKKTPPTAAKRVRHREICHRLHVGGTEPRRRGGDHLLLETATEFRHSEDHLCVSWQNSNTKKNTLYFWVAEKKHTVFLVCVFWVYWFSRFWTLLFCVLYQKEKASNWYCIWFELSVDRFQILRFFDMPRLDWLTRFLNRTGRICSRINQRVTRISSSLPQIEVGDIVEAWMLTACVATMFER